eukprot:CAMPEP_0204277600 /NCGR_PEP_ID=MMETSP0468-20130131/29400_1 /ASSEMBLY_ACC=CAM_ASM_000383 /TAXON_ID=2969 /ORGANISM="Oxyrrhis marina" /LENGTH=457 /DNA_ID=CAMNT_0051254411 /DNA_START=25 /DNA_END=1398 /DNA_ORIENTATION=+
MEAERATKLVRAAGATDKHSFYGLKKGQDELIALEPRAQKASERVQDGTADDEDAGLAEQLAPLQGALKKFREAFTAWLQSTDSQYTSVEKELAVAFLKGKIAEAKKEGIEKKAAGLTKILEVVNSATVVPEGSHIQKSQQVLAKKETELATLSVTLTKWEKGKYMFPSPAEQAKFLKSVEEAKSAVAAAEYQVEQMKRLKESAAPKIVGPPSTAGWNVAGAKSSGGYGKAGGKAKSKAKQAAVVRPMGAAPAGPVVIESAWCAAPPRVAPQPMVPTPAPAQPKPTQPQQPPQQQPKPKSKAKAAALPTRVDDGPPISYACLCTAIGEKLKINRDDVRQRFDYPETVDDFAQHFDPSTWSVLAERARTIEQKKKEDEIKKEQQRRMRAANPGGAPKAVPQVVGGGSGGYVSAHPKAKSQGKPQTLRKDIKKIATGNRFAGMVDSDSDDDFTTVKKKK